MTGMYLLALERIKSCETFPNKIIRFPVIFEKLCRNFSISKEKCWELLFLLREFGFIEVVRFQGIKINKEVYENMLT
jgi:hypothetical protein